MRRTGVRVAGSTAVAVAEGLEVRQLFAAGILPAGGDRGGQSLAAMSFASLTAEPSPAPSQVNTTLYDSASFEPPRFTTGALGGQDAAQGTWVKSGNPSAAVVETTVVAHGAQAVRLNRVNGLDARFASVHNVTPGTDTITINWSMRVDAATESQPFGPFFGVEAYHDLGNGVLRLIGTGGVDAKTGEILFQDAGSGLIDTTGITLGLGQFHSFKLVLDYATQQYSYFADDFLLRTEGFIDATPANPITGFSLASLSTFAAAGDALSLAAAGTAYFDDYSISSRTVVSPPQVSTFTVDDGTAQRSQVRSVTVKFDRPVTLASGAFGLSQLNTGGSGANDGTNPTDGSAVLGTPMSGDGGTTWVVPFTGASPLAEQRSDGTPTGSLVDGIYRLTVDPAKVTAGGVAMAGPGPTVTFHRLFGDHDGNRSVNTLDYGLFRNAFGKAAGEAGFDASFDFDGNGAINTSDYGQFRRRFGKALTY